MNHKVNVADLCGQKVLGFDWMNDDDDDDDEDNDDDDNASVNYHWRENWLFTLSGI